ncbi:hypothetical protein GGR21_001863 [Dysgonomonas hofstadii]|uniref:Uncharacterized protein n=1 Tax=Dysgonomonas hofstadii TaxID=637886 RepID=A0A840CPE5_9BACT|nr:hypothetical protein [Dysgonomonas hofstadii]MBB4035968.1 hypothetical protein [Dysgonomonas hofstadii]
MFLLPKAAKGTKNALVARPSCDPLQVHGLNQINSPAAQTVFGFMPLSPDGCPHCRLMPPGGRLTKQSLFCRRFATPAYVPQAGHPIRQWRRRTKSCSSLHVRFVFSPADERVLFVQPQRRFWVAGGMKP